MFIGNMESSGTNYERTDCSQLCVGRNRILVLNSTLFSSPQRGFCFVFALLVYYLSEIFKAWLVYYLSEVFKACLKSF